MDLVANASLIVGAVGTLVAVAVVVRGRQLTRSRISVTVGPPLPASQVSRTIRRLPFEGLVTGTVAAAPLRPFACPLIIRNLSKVAVSDLVLRLEYPSSCLADGVAFVDEVGGAEARVRRYRAKEGREVFQMSGVAYVSLDIGLLRPGEVIAAGELFALRAGLGTGEKDNSYFLGRFARMRRRYGGIDSLVTLVPVSVNIRAANLPPSGFQFNILWLKGSSPEELRSALSDVAWASWEGRWPRPGFYLRSWLSKPTLWRHARFTILQEEARSSDAIDPFEESMVGAVGAYACYVPVWGFDGESFDVGREVGVRLWGPRPRVI